MELIHRMSESVSTQRHQAPSGEPCDGALERLIARVGINAEIGNKGPSDSKLERLGFTKYVRGDKGYEKQFGADVAPGFIDREGN